MQKTVIENKESIQRQASAYLPSKRRKKQDEPFIHRLQIIQYMITHDASCVQAAKKFDTYPRTILGWLYKLNKTSSVESLREQPGKGRKTSLTPQHNLLIQKALKKTPLKVGLTGDTWTGKTLSAYLIQKAGITLKDRQCQRILQKNGFANKRGRPPQVPE
jgi:transposase